jgi:hypothetical protein
MPLKLQPGVQSPPAALIDRFYPQILGVARTWLWLARYVPVEITSWWRDETRNAAAGGATYSQHLVGTAMDGLVPGMTRAQLLPYVQRIAKAYGADAPSKASEGSGRSVHVQGLPYGTVEKLLRRDPEVLTFAQGFVGPPRPLA